MRSVALEAHEGDDYMAEMARRDSRKTSIMKNPKIIVHPQGVAAKASRRDYRGYNHFAPQNTYEPRGTYTYDGKYNYVVSTTHIDFLEGFPVGVVNSYIQREKNELFYDYLKNTPEYKNVEAGLAKIKAKLSAMGYEREVGLTDWGGARNIQYPFFADMVSSYIDVKLKKKNEISKVFQTRIADELTNNYQYYTKGKSIGAMTDEERITCASALGYGEGIAYDENGKAIAPDELNALLFMRMWNDGVFEVSQFLPDAKKVFSVVKSKNLPDRDITNPFWLDNATKMAIALSKTEDSEEASNPLFRILNLMEEGYKEADFIDANPQIRSIQFPHANRKGFRYHDVDADVLQRQYRSGKQKQAIRAMPTMTLDFAKVKPIIEKNVYEIENYMTDEATSSQSTYEEKEKKALASIKRMLPKIATQVMEQVASTTSYIKEEDYEVNGQNKRRGLFIDTTTNEPQSTVYVSFVPSFNQLGGRNYDFRKRSADGNEEYDYKAMQEWRLSTLASWATDDMQAFYQNHYQRQIGSFGGSRFSFNPSMLALGKLLREFGYEYNQSQGYLAYMNYRSIGSAGDYQTMLRVLKDLPKGENYRPIDSLTYIARTPKIGLKRIEDALMKAGFSPANADISEGTKCSLGDCLLMVGLGGNLFYPNESRGTRIEGSIGRNDQAQGQLLAASKNMARQARESLSGLITTQDDVNRVARIGMDTRKRYDLILPYLNNPNFKDKKIV